MTPKEVKAYKAALGARLDEILKTAVRKNELPEIDTPFTSTLLDTFPRSFEQRHGIHPYDALLKPPAGVTPDEVVKALLVVALEKRATLTQDVVTGEWKPGAVFKRTLDPDLAAENESITENKAIWAAKPHRFKAADWTHPNGHPRCLLCGDEEPVGGWCNMAKVSNTAKVAGERIEWGTVSGARYSGTIVETDGNIAVVHSDDGVERLVDGYVTKAAYMRAALAVPAGDGKIWAVRIDAKPNADGDGFHGWALPGGHIDGWESPEAAAVREFLEETGQLAELNGEPYPDLIEDWATTRIFPGVSLPGASGRQDEKVKAIEPWELKESERQALAVAGWINVVKAKWTIVKAGDVVAFDFDATMTIDEKLSPNVEVMSIIRDLQENGVPVRVLSARAGTAEGRAQISAWLDEHGLGSIAVTDAKTPDIRVIVDDRAMHYEPGTPLSADALAQYRSWFEKAWSDEAREAALEARRRKAGQGPADEADSLAHVVEDHGSMTVVHGGTKLEATLYKDSVEVEMLQTSEAQGPFDIGRTDLPARPQGEMIRVLRDFTRYLRLKHPNVKTITTTAYNENVEAMMIRLGGEIHGEEVNGKPQIRLAIDKLPVHKAGWDESEHPRAEDGKFGQGAGSSDTQPSGPKPAKPAINAPTDSYRLPLDEKSREHFGLPKGTKGMEILVANRATAVAEDGDTIIGRSPYAGMSAKEISAEGTHGLGSSIAATPSEAPIHALSSAVDDPKAKAAAKKALKAAYAKDPVLKDVSDTISFFTQGSYDDVRSIATMQANGSWPEVREHALKANPDRSMLSSGMGTVKAVDGAELVSQSVDSTARGVARLQAAIASAPPSPAPTYRGVGSSSPIPLPTKGQVIRFAGPSSFTRDQAVAREFSAGSNAGQRRNLGQRAAYRHQVVFELEAGAHGLNVDAFSTWKQKEFITQGEFEVVDIVQEHKTNPLDEFDGHGRSRHVVKLRQRAVYGPAGAPRKTKAEGTDVSADALRLWFGGDDDMTEVEKAGWDEAQHPRAEDGRFGNVAGAGAAKPKDTPVHHLTGNGPAVGVHTSRDEAAKLVAEAGGRLDAFEPSQFEEERKRGVKWLWWTHPKTESSSLWKIDPAKPMTVADIRAQLDAHLKTYEAADHVQKPGDADSLPWHSPENRKKAAEIGEHKIGDVVVYKGGSRLEDTPEKPGILKGERFSVTGYNGTNKDETTVYYRLRSLRSGKPQILAGHYLGKPGAEGVPPEAPPRPPAPPAPPVPPKPGEVVAPKPPKPAKPGKKIGTAPPPAGDQRQWRANIDSHYKAMESSTEMGKSLQSRMKSILKLHLGAESTSRPPHIDFSAFHPEPARRIAVELEQLTHEFPEAVANMTMISCHNLRNPSWWGAAQMSRMSFSMNDAMFGRSYSASSIGAATRSCAATGFHPKNNNNIESIAVHEFGHLVESHHYHKGRVDPMSHQGFSGPGDKSWMLKSLDYTALATASDYARTNRREAFAESFADYVMWRRNKQKESGRTGGDRTATDMLYDGNTTKTFAARTMEDFLKQHHKRIGDL